MAKRISSLLFLCMLAVCIVSCTSETKENKNQPSDETKEQPASKESEAVNPEAPAEEQPADNGRAEAYAGDWALLHAVVENENTESLDSYLALEGYDAEKVLGLIDEDVLADMKNTPYDDLKDSKFDGVDVKLYEYQNIASDAAGNEVGMVLLFYFEEQAEGLKLVGLLEAG